MGEDLQWSLRASAVREVQDRAMQDRVKRYEGLQRNVHGYPSSTLRGADAIDVLGRSQQRAKVGDFQSADNQRYAAQTGIGFETAYNINDGYGFQSSQQPMMTQPGVASSGEGSPSQPLSPLIPRPLDFYGSSTTPSADGVFLDSNARYPSAAQHQFLDKGAGPDVLQQQRYAAAVAAAADGLLYRHTPSTPGFSSEGSSRGPVPAVRRHRGGGRAGASRRPDAEYGQIGATGQRRSERPQQSLHDDQRFGVAEFRRGF